MKNTPIFPVKAKYFVKGLISIMPFRKQIVALAGNYWMFRKNFGKIKFQGEQLQDMIAYMYLPKKKNGFYIDIGANHGIIANNTYIFEQLGWKGVCVEPQPDIFKQFLKKFRNCDCYNVAVSSRSNESVEFYQSQAHALSGFDDTLAAARKEYRATFGKAKIINVKTITFDELMRNYPGTIEIDLISIDVEGHEMEILKTIDFQKYKFKMLIIEKSEPEQITELLERAGYKIFMEIGADIMFVPEIAG